jgi:hypothetical protein
MKNTTGLPDPGSYLLGGGCMFGAFVDSTTQLRTSGWFDLGNSPSISLEVDSETVEHESSRTGIKEVDVELTTKRTVSMTFSLDEINDRNLSLWVGGDEASFTNPGRTYTASNLPLSTSVTLGQWYDLVDNTGARMYDLQATPTFRETAGPTTLVLDTDYTVDAKWGRVFLKTTATNIADGEALDYSYTPDGSEVATLDEVRALGGGEKELAILFISENAQGEKQREYVFHRVNLTANGSLDLIGDDFSQMSFDGAIKKSILADPLAPYYRVRDFLGS